MKLLAVDGNSIINRAFFGVRSLGTKNGQPTNAIYGLLSMLNKYIDDVKPDAVVFAFDLKESTFRHKMYSEYKAGRHAMPDELFCQLEPAKEIISALGYPIITCTGYEADDILGTISKLCEENKWECVLATGDRDSFQLITDSTKVYYVDKIMDKNAIMEKYGLSPKQMIDLKGLMGDSSDHIPGIMGIGEKTALELLHKYGSLEEVFNHAEELKGALKAKIENGKDSAYMSRKLGTICQEAPIGLTLNELIPKEMDKDKLAELLTKLELKKFLDKYNLKEVDVKQETPEKNEYKIDEPLEPILRDMEKVGFSVNKDALIEYGKELDNDLNELEERIYFLAGEKFNINSPKQLGEVLFSHLGILGGKKTKTGYSTDAETLEKLSHYHPVINEVISYRKLAKLKSTYVDGLVDKIGSDGKLHTTFNLDKTRTGRLSSSDPNLQNIPVRTERGSQLRKFFVASPGKVLVDADYSQIELRVLAYMAQDKAMLEAFSSGMDIHTQTAAKIFDMPVEFVTPQMRSRAKAVNFGIVYGISAFGLANDIGVSNKEAKEYIDSYNRTYIGINEYMESVIEFAKKNGYVETLFGYRRYIPELKIPKTRAFGERIARNTPIQGTAAEIIKLAMVNVFNRLNKECPKAKLIMQVHDELIVECEENDINQVSDILKTEMENVIKDKYTFKVDIHTGKNWLEAKG